MCCHLQLMQTCRPQRTSEAHWVCVCVCMCEKRATQTAVPFCQVMHVSPENLLLLFLWVKIHHVEKDRPNCSIQHFILFWQVFKKKKKKCCAQMCGGSRLCCCVFSLFFNHWKHLKTDTDCSKIIPISIKRISIWSKRLPQITQFVRNRNRKFTSDCTIWHFIANVQTVNLTKDNFPIPVFVGGVKLKVNSFK